MGRRPVGMLVCLLASGALVPGCAWQAPQAGNLPAATSAQAAADRIGRNEPRKGLFSRRVEETSLDQGRVAMARLNERRGQPKQAEQRYLRMIEENPQQPLPRHRLGVLLAQLGNFAEAEQRFQEAAQLGPPSAELLSDMGYAYYLSHRMDDAERVLREAVDLDPNYSPGWNNLGLVLGQIGNTKESLAAFRRATSEAEAYANLAYVMTQVGDLRQAQAYYRHSLTLDNTLRPAAEAMIQVAQRQRLQRLPSAPGGMDQEGVVQVAHAEPAEGLPRATRPQATRPQATRPQATHPQATHPQSMPPQSMQAQSIHRPRPHGQQVPHAESVALAAFDHPHEERVQTPVQAPPRSIPQPIFDAPTLDYLPQASSLASRFSSGEGTWDGAFAAEIAPAEVSDLPAGLPQPQGQSTVRGVVESSLDPLPRQVLEPIAGPSLAGRLREVRGDWQQLADEFDGPVAEDSEPAMAEAVDSPSGYPR